VGVFGLVAAIAMIVAYVRNNGEGRAQRTTARAER
jgi:hypothetical protein